MKKRTTAMLGITIAAVFCAGVMMAQAEPAFAKDAGAAVSAKAGQSDAAFAFKKGSALNELKAQGASYPDAFDLRNVNGKSYVTPVKLQNPYGTCWGFAAIAAAESSLIASGLADENVDLSEKHLAYFTTTCLDDPDSPQIGGVSDADGNYSYNEAGLLAVKQQMYRSPSQVRRWR